MRDNTDKNVTEEELAMSDQEFEKNYLEVNKRWFENYEEYHKRTNGGVKCAETGCRERLTIETMRPYGGKNYCSKHFKAIVSAEMQHYFGLDHLPTPEMINRFEWCMKVARVLDGGLVKIAETTDPDLD